MNGKGFPDQVTEHIIGQSSKLTIQMLLDGIKMSVRVLMILEVKKVENVIDSVHCLAVRYAFDLNKCNQPHCL